ncbi:MAG: hypothetical protein J6A02_01300 [Prevotella sp.]|nr:hypothetical protein [Prevotella sp.]
MKIKEDMPLFSGGDRGRYFVSVYSTKTNVIYLLLTPSVFFYLQKLYIHQK